MLALYFVDLDMNNQCPCYYVECCRNQSCVPPVGEAHSSIDETLTDWLAKVSYSGSPIIAQGPCTVINVSKEYHSRASIGLDTNLFVLVLMSFDQIGHTFLSVTWT